MSVQIQRMHPEDWPAVRGIYRQGIETGHATFEQQVPDYPTWDRAHLPDPRLVARLGPRVAGWAALSPASYREVYRGVAEVSVYVAESFRRQGVGKGLLQALIVESERLGIWTLQAGVFPENLASITLHRSCGFRQVGVRERLGRLRGEWRDVLLLERRSTIAGI